MIQFFKNNKILSVLILCAIAFLGFKAYKHWKK